MKNPVNEMNQKIRELLLESYKACVAEGLLPEAELLPFDIEQPREAQNGDFSSNFAMKNVRVLRKAPQMIGNMLVEHLPACPEIERAEVAGPGFLNFYLGGAYFTEVAKTAAALGGEYGKTDRLKGERIMVEFVSANPTGPMHMGNARGGVVGDSLGNVLSWAGAEVHKEFYVNNAGNQVALFGLSLYTRLQQLVHGEDYVEFPENGYHGDDIKVLAKTYLEAHPEAAEESEEVVTPKLIAFGLENNIARMKSDLAKYKIHFDEWFLESTLHESGYVAETVKLLEDRGWMYEQEGAKWFKATEFGCEKDEVLVKANGFYTYYAVDIAYHRNKFEKRGFDRCIDVFGADHHGHTLRFKAAMAAIGQDQEKLQFVLMQLVRLTRLYGMDAKGNPPKVLIVAPPPALDTLMSARHGECFGEQAIAVTKGLAAEYARIAKLLRCEFFDAAGWAEVSPSDAVHLTAKGHIGLAEGLTKKIQQILN